MIVKDLDIREYEWPLKIILSANQSLKKRCINILLCTMILPTILVIVTYFIENNFYLKRPGVGLIQDLNILCMFSIFPIALILLNLVLNRFKIFLSEMPNLISLDIPIEITLKYIYKSIIAIITHQKGWKIIRLLFILGGILFVMFNAYNRYYLSDRVYFQGFWTSSNYPISFWITNIYTMIVWGYICPIIGFILVTIIIVIFKINKILIKGVGFNLKPLSFDNFGGLKPLTDLALAMCYISIPFQVQAIIYYLWIPQTNYPFIIGLSAVISLTILMFGLPITITHKAMVDAKKRVLDLIAKVTNKEYTKVIALFRDNTDYITNSFTNEHDIRFERIINLKGLYQLIDDIPVWPILDVKVISRFIGAIFAPTLAFMLKIWLE